MSSPTQRSLKHLRDQGYLVAVVEKFNSFTKRRIDLWGFGDLLAIKGNETMIVQSTSGTNVSARVNKIQLEPAIHSVASFWLESPNRTIQIHGWRKGGPRGKRKTWICRVLSGRIENGLLTFTETFPVPTASDGPALVGEEH